MNHSYKNKKWFLPVLFVCSFTAAAQERPAPKLFQVTTAETRPGDAVMVKGEYMDQVKEIRMSRLKDDQVAGVMPLYTPAPHEDHLPGWKGTERRSAFRMTEKPVDVAILQQNRQSLKFIVPPGWQEGIYSVNLISPGEERVSFYVNVPKVNWVISEEGQQAVTGDYLRIQGKNLLRKGYTGRAVIIPEGGGKMVTLNVEKTFDDFSVQVRVPSDAPTGKYQLYYHNGQGGTTGWSEPLAVTVINRPVYATEAKLFNVLDFGAKGDGLHNETAAFRAALDAADKNGGGTVFVPRGRYMLTGELIISPHTIFRGESATLSQLFWNPLNWDTNELPGSLLTGSHHFTIRNLNIWATRAWGIIMQAGPLNEQGNVTLENLVVRQTPEMGGFMYYLKSNRDAVEAELNTRWNKTGIILHGSNLKVRNCDFNSNGMYSFSAASGFVQHCRFTRRNTGINQPYMTVHPKGLIFEDCERQADGYGYAATIDESYNLYEARNTTPFDYTNDRESMTLDGGSGGYSGGISAAKGNTLVLSPKGLRNQWVPNKWIGGGVFILTGKGAGQYRRIAKHGLDTLQLDEPFLVDPDSTSYISITTVRKNLFYIDNEVTDAGAYQFYGSIANAVISGLKMQRSSGIVSRGSLLYGGKQPNWYVDIVNCDLSDGNYCHWFGTGDRGHSGYQRINLIGNGGGGMNLGGLIRRNRLRDFSYIATSPGNDPNAVTDLIIEDNFFHIAKSAIVIGGSGTSTSQLLIHRNHYNEVEEQVSVQPTLKPAAYQLLDDGKP